MIIGLTTAGRKLPTLDLTTKSIKHSGWQDIHLFADYGSSYDERQYKKISRRKELYGAWKNWFYALNELYQTYDQKFYILCQDDIILCKNTYEYINSLSDLPDRVGFLSLYTPDSYLGEGMWNAVQDKDGIKWAQFLIFPRHIVPSLLASSEVWRANGNAQIDIRVGVWTECNNLLAIYHAPSLVQHIGESSAIWNNAKLSGQRLANSYVGDDFDCLSLIKKVT